MTRAAETATIKRQETGKPPAPNNKPPAHADSPTRREPHGHAGPNPTHANSPTHAESGTHAASGTPQGLGNQTPFVTTP
ncbi:hypothetical protein GCM10028793_37310 [Nocardiopsis oceani]